MWNVSVTINFRPYKGGVHFFALQSTFHLLPGYVELQVTLYSSGFLFKYSHINTYIFFILCTKQLWKHWCKYVPRCLENQEKTQKSNCTCYLRCLFFSYGIAFWFYVAKYMCVSAFCICALFYGMSCLGISIWNLQKTHSISKNNIISMNHDYLHA